MIRCINTYNIDIKKKKKASIKEHGIKFILHIKLYKYTNKETNIWNF